MKKVIGKVLLDMIPVILGILIVVLINNWKQNRDDQKFVTSILTSISFELNENAEELSLKIKEHGALIDTIKVYINESDLRIGDLLQKGNGIRLPVIKNTSWKSFLNPKIELVDFKMINHLSTIEEFKDALNHQSKELMSFVYSNLNKDSWVSKQTFQMLLGDIKHLEEKLLETHKMYLEL